MIEFCYNIAITTTNNIFSQEGQIMTTFNFHQIFNPRFNPVNYSSTVRDAIDNDLSPSEIQNVMDNVNNSYNFFYRNFLTQINKDLVQTRTVCKISSYGILSDKNAVHSYGISIGDKYNIRDSIIIQYGLKDKNIKVILIDRESEEPTFHDAKTMDDAIKIVESAVYNLDVRRAFINIDKG